AAAAGSVQFKDGSSNLGAPVAVAGGTGSMSTSALAVGTHSLTAGFIPAGPALFNWAAAAAGSVGGDSEGGGEGREMGGVGGGGGGVWGAVVGSGCFGCGGGFGAVQGWQ